MRTSESTGQLMKALVAAQGKFPKLAKDKTAEVAMKSGGKYSYSYADLASVLDVIRPVLAEHKIAVVQAPDLDDNGRQVLISRLAHESSEWVEGRYLLPDDASAQEMGSAITYARRYSLCALAGVTAEDDDDGQRATRPTRQRSRPADQPAQSRPATAATPGSRDELVARLKKVLPDDHPRKSLLSSMSDRQLSALAKSLKLDVGTAVGSEPREASDPSPLLPHSPEGEGLGIERVGASPSPEGDYADHWEAVAKRASMWIDQLLTLAQTFPEGKDLGDLKELYGVGPESVLGKQLEKALLGNRREPAA